MTFFNRFNRLLFFNWNFLTTSFRLPFISCQWWLSLVIFGETSSGFNFGMALRLVQLGCGGRILAQSHVKRLLLLLLGKFKVRFLLAIVTLLSLFLHACLPVLCALNNDSLTFFQGGLDRLNPLLVSFFDQLLCFLIFLNHALVTSI